MRRDTESGIALLSVLWGLLALSVIAAIVTSITYRTRVETGSYRVETQMRYAALGAVDLAIRDFLAKPTGERRAFIGRPQKYSVGDFEVAVRLSDEAGHININLADEELLTSLIEYLGEDEETARGIAQSILDWRDDNDVAMAKGAEALEYAALGQPGRPRNAPFQSVGELARVAGMTDKIFSCLQPLVTVYSASAIDPTVATNTVNSFIAYEENDKDSKPRQSLLNPNAGTGVTVYRIDAEVDQAKRRYDYRVIVRLTGRKERPWTTLFSARTYDLSNDRSCGTVQDEKRLQAVAPGTLAPR